MPNGHPLELEGQVIGCYRVLRRATEDEHPRGKGIKPQWLCRCECGAERFVRSTGLMLRPKACGLDGHRYVFLRHGRKVSTFPEYGSWEKMRERCGNPKHEKFPNYGGRGITVCPQWGDFMTFLRDMGPKPTREHSIERKDVNGNYEPDNCVWATNDEQCRNKTNTIWVEWQGVKVKLVDLADELGIDNARIAGRLRIGWDLERAITTPVEPRKIYMTKRRRALLEQAGAI